jgi:hypothetical protein
LEVTNGKVSNISGGFLVTESRKLNVDASSKFVRFKGVSSINFCSVFVQFKLTNLKAKVATGVMLQLAVQQSV